MPRVYVEFERLQEVGNSCRDIAASVEELRSEFLQTMLYLDWDIKYTYNINNTAKAIGQKLEEYKRILCSYQEFTENACEQYRKLNEEMEQNDIATNDLIKIEFLPIRLIPGIPAPIPAPNLDDLIPMLVSLLDVVDSWLGEKQGGVGSGTVSYLKDFIDFFTGDKKGWTGVSDWFDLAESSVKLWSKAYDYLAEINKEEGLKIFEQADQNVAVLGLTTGALGLVSSLLEASNELDQKKWQSITADYLNSGKHIFSIIKSGYELKHINDINSLADIKAGVWSPLDIYTAIGEAGIAAIAQGFKSHERYSADGEWNIGDTGATGIDISMAGLYGLTHVLTLGLDTVFFSKIDKMSGGNGTSEKSYYEKAAEGIKIMMNEVGEAIGNGWSHLIK